MHIEGLLPSQNADIVRTILDSPFPLEEFEVIETSLPVDGFESVTALRHAPSSATFGFGRLLLERTYEPEEDFDGTGHSVVMNPGWERRVEVWEAREWYKVPRHVKDWLDNLSREREAENFLSRIARTRPPRSATPEDPESYYSTAEREQLLERLGRMEESLQSATSGTAELRSYVAEQFDSLREQLAKMNRGSWRKWALGTLASMAVDAVVPAPAIQDAWALARGFWVEQIGRLANPE